MFKSHLSICLKTICIYDLSIHVFCLYFYYYLVHLYGQDMCGFLIPSLVLCVLLICCTKNMYYFYKEEKCGILKLARKTLDLAELFLTQLIPKCTKTLLLTLPPSPWVFCFGGQPPFQDKGQTLYWSFHGPIYFKGPSATQIYTPAILFCG